MAEDCERCGGSGFDPSFDGDGPMECRLCHGSPAPIEYDEDEDGGWAIDKAQGDSMWDDEEKEST